MTRSSDLRPPRTLTGRDDPRRRPCDLAWLSGAAAGCARGLVAGRRRALRAVLRARFGPLDADTEARVEALPPDALGDAVERAATADRADAPWDAR